MKQIAVSVIIPVYNGETYLRQCLDSVRAQTLENIEIICIDDLSTDASWSMLEEYQAADPRFRLIRHTENQGVSAARNSGLAIARGDYVIFWDCDDFFEPGALELLEEKSRRTNTDICVCGADRYFTDREKSFPFPGYLNLSLTPQDAETFNRHTNEKYILNFTTVALWNKFFRRAFLLENRLTMPSFRFGEDICFSISALCLAERITTVDNVLVHYRVNNPNSLVGQFGTKPIDFRPRLAVSEHLRSMGILPEDSFGRSSIADVIYLLRMAKTKEVFLDAVRFLHEDGILEKLCITEREPEYYRDARQEQYAKHLIHDTPEDFLAFLMHGTYLELREATASRNDFRSSRDKLEKRLATDAEAHERELAQLSDEKARLEKKNRSLDRKSKRLQQAQATLTTENNRQAAALEALTAEKQRLQDEIGSLSEDAWQWQAIARNLSGDRRRLQAEIKSLTDQIARQQAELQSMMERNQRLTAQEEQLTALLEKTELRLQSTEATLRDVLSSRTFRLGKAVMYVPQKVAAPFRKK